MCQTHIRNSHDICKTTIVVAGDQSPGLIRKITNHLQSACNNHNQLKLKRAARAHRAHVARSFWTTDDDADGWGRSLWVPIRQLCGRFCGYSNTATLSASTSA